MLRGGTWQGLAREIAWEAVRARGGELEWLDPLTSLVGRQLSLRVERVEPAVERSALAAAREYARAWPHDPGGAATSARLEASTEATRLLAGAYREVLEWATQVVDERIEHGAGRSFGRRFAFGRRRFGNQRNVPTRIANSPIPEERFGWSSVEAS
jgi:hypothetical protein